MIAVDYLWAIYIRRVNEGNALQAAVTSMALMLFGGLVTISYVDNKWFLIPAAIGCILGTFFTVRHDHKK